MALFVEEQKLRNLVQAKFRHNTPYWAMEKILDEIVEECKKWSHS